MTTQQTQDGSPIQETLDGQLLHEIIHPQVNAAVQCALDQQVTPEIGKLKSELEERLDILHNELTQVRREIQARPIDPPSPRTTIDPQGVHDPQAQTSNAGPAVGATLLRRSVSPVYIRPSDHLPTSLSRAAIFFGARRCGITKEAVLVC